MNTKTIFLFLKQLGQGNTSHWMNMDESFNRIYQRLGRRRKEIIVFHTRSLPNIIMRLKTAITFLVVLLKYI